MNKIEMNIKLNLLLENDVITDKAFNITNQTFEFLSEKYGKLDLKKSEMFWQHMCMALTRIEKGESLESHSGEIIKEINQTPYKNDIEEIISFVSVQFGEVLPVEEQNYFYIHLHGIVENNKEVENDD